MQEVITEVPEEFNHQATMSWKIMNLDDKNFDALIGQNILSAVGAIIDLGKGTIEISGRVTKFQNSCPYTEIYQLQPIRLDENSLLNH